MQMQQRYNYTKSPFYKLKSKKFLAKILNVSLKELDKIEKLSNTEESIYDIFTVGEKKREIQNPVHPLLKKVQKRIFNLMNRLEMPEYVFSGKKGKSYISNASVHKNSNYILTLDIEHFYASTKAEFVFQFFLHKMKMASDLAHIITNISTYKDFSTNNRKIPTGSQLSQILAYWVYSDMFNSISKLANENQCIFSLYVDDMTFSSQLPIQRDFHKKVEEVLQSKKLRFKRSKVRYYTKNQAKKVTGVIITQDHNIDIPNKRLKDASKSIGKALSPTATEQEKQSVLGKINSIQQIKPNIFSGVIKQLSKNKYSYNIFSANSAICEI